MQLVISSPALVILAFNHSGFNNANPREWLSGVLRATILWDNDVSRFESHITRRFPILWVVVHEKVCFNEADIFPWRR